VFVCAWMRLWIHPCFHLLCLSFLVKSVRPFLFYLFFSNEKSTFLWANLLTLEPFAPLNDATRGPSPMGGTSVFLLYLGDCENGEVGGMNGFWQGTRSAPREPAPDATLSTTNPTCQTGVRTRAAAVGSQRLTASAMARPSVRFYANLCA
jgi:hypothetical protein